MRQLILAALIAVIPAADASYRVEQSLEETGVYLGFFYGCYNTSNYVEGSERQQAELGEVCILPPSDEEEEGETDD